MSQGTVKWFNPRKGYGFISVDDGENDVFVHANEVTGKGPMAKNVKVIE